MKFVFIRVHSWLKTSLFLACLSAAAADPISESLQKGLFEEEANHNLEAAIKAYQSVIDQTAEQRKLTATAVFRLGECYRKLNKTNEAVAQYQRVVREFSDVVTLATLSQQNLAALGVNVVRRSELAAATSAEADEIDKIKAMIKYSPDLISAPNPSGQTPLSRAALLGYLAVARFLLDNKAEVDARDYDRSTPIHRATEAGHRTIVELLLDRGADVNAWGQNKNRPLHLATGKGYRSIVELLLARKADVNGKGESDRTPLLAATENSALDVARLLLERGANVNAQNEKGYSALHHAYYSPELMKLLLQYKPNLELQAEEGRTPLLMAVANGDPQCVEFLLQAGADPNAATKDTPLILAIRIMNKDKVQSLLKYKADPNQPSSQNDVLPLRYALSPGGRSYNTIEKQKLAEIAELLRKYGAKEEVSPGPSKP